MTIIDEEVEKMDRKRRNKQRQGGR